MKRFSSKFPQFIVFLFFFCGMILLPVDAQDDTHYVDSQFALMRLNPDGSIDNSFDQDGRVLTDFASTVTEWATAVTLTGSGKIVAAGTAYHEEFGYVFALARYNADGSLDTSFDEDGKVLTEFSSTSVEVIEAVVMAGGGKIVAAGWATMEGAGHVFALARYNSDGSLDTTFDGDGKVLTDFAASTDERIMAVDMNDNGQIVVAGWATTGNGHVFALARYNADGSLDQTFQGGGAGPGKVLTDIDSSWGDAGGERIEAMIIGRDGKIVVGGTAHTVELGYVFALARYNANGSLDTTFESDGIVLIEWFDGTDEGITDLALPGGGKIVAVGSAFSSEGSVFAIMRVNVDGTIDDTFDQGGAFTNINASTNEYLSAAALDANGRLVAGGTAFYNGGYVFALARYFADGTLDGTFVGAGSANGKIMAGIPATDNEQSWDLVVDDAGRIIMVGAAGTLAPPLRYPY